MTEPMLQFFEYDHLPVELQTISQRFYELAHNMVLSVTWSPERDAALRKLLEAKDCAVRAKIYKEEDLSIINQAATILAPDTDIEFHKSRGETNE